MRKTFIRTSAVATIFALLVSTGVALADRDGKGKGGGGGGGGDRSGSSDRGGSSRSSSGGGDRSSSRSNSKSSDSNKSSFNSSDSNKSSSKGQSTFRSSNKGSDDSNKTFQPPKQFQYKPDQSGSKSKDGSRDYQVRRPSDDQTRDFIKQGNINNNNKNVDRSKDRSPKDREVVDREFNNWRNTWNGDKNSKGDKVGDGKNSHDHRDWSGNWKNSDRFTTADRIRNDWRRRNNNDFVFNDNWWSGNRRGNSWNFWGNYGRRYQNPFYWWSWTNGPRLGSWYTFNWQQPYYWDYGQGEYIYTDNGAVYVNGRWYQPAPVFYNQTVELVDQNPPLTADSAAKLDWLPLGVFAVTPDGLNEPDITVQLATTKDGLIGGTAFDTKTNAAFNVQGTVDKKTQRAVWSFTNDKNQRVMMETSVYNLTQPEATGLVHYGPNDMRVVELVRLQQPEAGAANSSPSLPAPPVNQ